MTQLVQIMRTLRSMPPLPDVALRVMQIVRDPEYSIDGLVRVVRTDPALTARILKLCNSALFGLPNTITSVSDAVAYLGTRNLVKLVLVTCSANYFQKSRTSFFGTPATIWQHSIATATACQFLAERCGYSQPATAFTAGILHDVGKVALGMLVENDDAAQAALAATHTNDDARECAALILAERHAVGIDHATAGGIVTESWNLPVELRRAVRNHHDTGMIRQDDELTAMLHVADLVALQMGIGAAPDHDYRFDEEALARLRLGQHDLDAVHAAVGAELDKINDSLNLDRVAGR